MLFVTSKDPVWFWFGPWPAPALSGPRVLVCTSKAGVMGCCIVTAPPLEDVATAFPCASAATLLSSWIGEEVFVVELDTISDRVARTPFEMVVALRPQRTQVVEPAVLLQLTDLFAASPPPRLLPWPRKNPRLNS